MKTIKQLVVIILILLVVANVASYFYLGSTERDIPPEISCPNEVLEISALDTEEDLLVGVTAKDKQDGDLTDRITVAGISKLITNDTAKVTYLVFDRDNNMASCVRRIRYVDYHRPTFEVTEPLVYSTTEEVAMLARLKAIDVVDGDIVYDVTFNTDRTRYSHVLAASVVSDGALRVVAYSTEDAPFIGNEGVMVNVAVAVDDYVSAGDYGMNLRNVRMVKSGVSEVLGANSTATLSVVRNTLMGDVNSDGKYSISDVVMVVNAVLEKPQANFNVAVADMNGDGNITMGDAILVLRLVLTDGKAMAPARSASPDAVPVLSAGDLAAMADGRVALPVALDNSEAYSAFQLDVVLPAGVEITEATLTGRAKASHAVAWNTLSDGKVRIVAYALDNAAFRGNEGALLNLVLTAAGEQPADATITLADGLFATVSGAEHRAEDVSVMMRSEATGVDALSGAIRVSGAEGAVVVQSAADAAISIYAMTGQLVQQAEVKAGKSRIALPAGVYVINGNKITVK